MDQRKDVHDFLASRRARITPAQAGLPVFDDNRRVAGLRREEVASLAGVSIDYYARLERGNLRGVSGTVLEALVRALRLDDAERAYLFDLAHAANATTAARSRRAKATRTSRDPVRQSVRSILAGMTGTPAYVRNARMDILAANDLCTVLYDGILEPEALPVNLARFVFLDDPSREFFGDWDTMADQVVGALRTEAGRSPADRALSDLVGELTTRSDEFSARWAQHNVRLHNTARKTLRTSLVGDVELTGEALQLPGDDLIVIAYSAAPGSPAEEKLSFLASWAAQHRRPATGAAGPASPQSAGTWRRRIVAVDAPAGPLPAAAANAGSIPAGRPRWGDGGYQPATEGTLVQTVTLNNGRAASPAWTPVPRCSSTTVTRQSPASSAAAARPVDPERDGQ